MTWSDLKAAHGGGKAREQLNRAIRAELVGGDECLAALELVDRVELALVDRDLPGVAEARAARTALLALRDVMAEEIMRRYGISAATPTIDTAPTQRRRTNSG